MVFGADVRVSRRHVSRRRSRSYRTSSGPPHSQRFQGLPASYFRLHTLHSRCVTKLSGMRIFHLIGAVAAGITALAFPVQAGEYAVLANGFRLHADRHEVDDGVVRLYAEGGVTEMAVASVVRFEQEEEIPAGTPCIDTSPAPDVTETPMDLAAAAA